MTTCAAQFNAWFNNHRCSLCSVVGELRTCFRFRSKHEAIEVLIEGDATWVKRWRDDLGLSDVGWLERLSIDDGSESDDAPSVSRGPKESVGLPGPTPDPSKLVEVRRTIGELDLEAGMMKLGVAREHSPDSATLREILDEYDEAPKPPSGTPSTEPVAEGWLREVFRIAVRRFGVMGLPTEVIVESIDGRHDLDDDLIEGWIETQYQLGKLVKIHGGKKEGFGPSPSWLDAP